MRRLLPLMGIIAIAFLLILVGSALIFEVIIPMPNLLPGTEGVIFTALIKVLLSSFLALGWVYALMMITEFYMRRKIG